MTDVAVQLSEEQAEFRAAVQQGIDEADRGDTEDFYGFAAEFRAAMAARVAAGGA